MTNKLPKGFPEYSLLHKNLSKKIRELKNEQTITKNEILKKQIQTKIETYQKEITKIESMFPEKFFDDNF